MKSNVKKAMAAIAAAVVCAIPMTNAVTASAASGLRRDTGIRTANTASGTGMKGADAIPAATTTTGKSKKSHHDNNNRRGHPRAKRLRFHTRRGQPPRH